MEEEHRSRLKQNKVALQGNLHIDEILLSHLIAEEVLTDAMKEQIDVRIPLFLTFRVHLDKSLWASLHHHVAVCFPSCQVACSKLTMVLLSHLLLSSPLLQFPGNLQYFSKEVVLFSCVHTILARMFNCCSVY